MKHNKFLDVIGTILLFIGFFLAFLPHAYHLALGLDESVSHTKHIIGGIALVIISLAILIYNNKSFKFQK